MQSLYLQRITKIFADRSNEKTKPIQTQFKPNLTQNKPNSKPIKPKQTQFVERAKMNPFAWITSFKMIHFDILADFTNLKGANLMKRQNYWKFIYPCYTKTPSKTDGNDIDIYTMLYHYIQYLICFLTSEVVRRRKLRFSITNNTETSSI